MERLDAAVHHFRKACYVLYRHDGDTCIAEGPHGAACGDDFNAELSQSLAEFDDACFIRNTEQCAFYLHENSSLVFSTLYQVAFNSQLIFAKELYSTDICRVLFSQDAGSQRVFRIRFVDRYG